MNYPALSEVVGGFTAQQEGRRSIEASVGFGLAHRYRIEILAVLHDRPATLVDLVVLLKQPRHRLRYHLDELMEDGSIEVAGRETRGNVVQHVYRVTRLAYHSSEEWLKMPLADRQIETALILQATWTEALASLWAGKFNSDPTVTNVWNRILLDEEGRDELAIEQEQSWTRIEELEASAAARRVRSGATGAKYIVAAFGYERARSAPPDPQPDEVGQWDHAGFGDLLKSAATAPGSVEKAISKVVAHRIRIEILAALHEGPATASELSKMIGQPVTTLHYHLRRLLRDEAILLLDHRSHRNFQQPVYGVVKLPCYDYDAWRRLSRQERQVISAVTLRAAMAESLAALWAGKLHTDPRLVLAWKPILLDAQGRNDLADEHLRSWNAICAIEEAAATRRRDRRAEVKMHVVTMLGFERSRPPTDPG